MDAKYGRLFTEKDVTALVCRAFAIGRAGPLPEDERNDLDAFRDRVVREVEARLANPLTFPADEPLFLLRGQDKAVYDEVMGAYVDASEAVGASMDHMRKVGRAFGAIMAWQLQHPDRVKVPD